MVEEVKRKTTRFACNRCHRFKMSVREYLAVLLIFKPNSCDISASQMGKKGAKDALQLTRSAFTRQWTLLVIERWLAHRGPSCQTRILSGLKTRLRKVSPIQQSRTFTCQRPLLVIEHCLAHRGPSCHTQILSSLKPRLCQVSPIQQSSTSYSNHRKKSSQPSPTCIIWMAILSITFFSPLLPSLTSMLSHPPSTTHICSQPSPTWIIWMAILSIPFFPPLLPCLTSMLTHPPSATHLYKAKVLPPYLPQLILRM